MRVKVLNVDERIVEAVSEMFILSGKGNEEERAMAYVRALADFNPQLLEKALEKLRYEKSFLPSIAEITTAYKALAGEMIPSLRVKSWDEAWKEIQREMETTFVYGKPKWSSPEIKQAVDSFGWTDLCTTPAKDMAIVRAQVRQIYESACKTRADRAMSQFVLQKAGIEVIDGGSGKLLRRGGE